MTVPPLIKGSGWSGPPEVSCIFSAASGIAKLLAGFDQAMSVP